MLDLKLIRDNPQAFDAALAKRGPDSKSLDEFELGAELSKAALEIMTERGVGPTTGAILALDAARRQTVTTLQDAQSRRNQISKDVGKAKAAKREDEAQKLMAEVATLKDAIATGESRDKEISAKLDDLLAGIPNLPAENVPLGDESANTEIRRWRDKPNFAFEPKQHFELGEALGMMDFETAAKLSGSRFVVLKGALARMERALANFMLDMHTGEFGYEEVSPPLLVKDPAMFGTGQLPKFSEDLFFAASALIPPDVAKRAEELESSLAFGETKSRDALDEVRKLKQELEGYDKDVQSKYLIYLNLIEAILGSSLARADFVREALDLVKKLESKSWLVPTAEVPLTNLVRESILVTSALPLRFVAHTPCFRAEAGSAGRDTRGMIRLHQFSKVELVSITTPEQSEAEHERMTACAEEVLKRLSLPYRTMVLATGDMGFSARKTYDIEVWLPGQNAYREISSCSNCGDFQARRMNARYRPEGGKDVRFVHTLNGSALAVGRTLVAILENYQQEDGSIRIPDVLVPYMGGLEVIAAPR